MRIENWQIRAGWNGELYAIGNVFGNPQFPAGYPIQTSHLVGKQCGCIITHSGSCYTLGKVDPEYEGRIPDPFNKLLSQLKEMPLTGSNRSELQQSNPPQYHLP